MKCPYCSDFNNKVINTRFSSNGSSIRRRRGCENCERRFTTYEKIEDNTLTVIKKDGLREGFDESKMLKGILLSTEKRNLSQEILENIVLHIQKEVEDSGKMEIKSVELGNLVMQKLKEIDKIAYLRFASVYKNFDDVESFIHEIRDIGDQ